MWTVKARAVAAGAVVFSGTCVVLLARCSDHGDVADASDAGADIRRDAVSTDSGVDVDGAIDAPCSITSDWPGFRRLTEFDPCLPADVLVDPDAGYNVTWTDCDAGIAGCKELIQLVPQQFAYAYATPDDAGSGGALFLEQGIDNSLTRQFDIIEVKTLARLGEWRIDLDNAYGTQVALPNTTTAATAFLGYKPELNVDIGPAQTLFSNALSLTPFPTAPTQPINWAISGDVMAWQSLSAPYSICKVDAGSCVPMNISSIAPAVPYLTFAWHDVAFAVAEHGTTGWAQEYVIRSDGSISLLRSNPNAHIWGMTTDGTTLVWEETYGSTNFLDAQTTTEVWKAPFTTDKSMLDTTATKVTTLPQAGIGGSSLAELAFFNGVYATWLHPPTDAIYVVNLLTGQTQGVIKGAGGLVGGLPYVDKNELWQVTSTLDSKFSLARIPFSQPWN